MLTEDAETCPRNSRFKPQSDVRTQSCLSCRGDGQAKESMGRQVGHCAQAQGGEQHGHAGLGSAWVLRKHNGADGALSAEEVASGHRGAWGSMDSFVHHSDVFGGISAGEPCACH